MDVRYKYGHRPGRRRRTRVLIVLFVSLLIFGVIGGLIGYDAYKNRNTTPVEGTSRTVIQTLDDSTDKLTIDEPAFRMELPGDWKEIGRINDKNENSITWQAGRAEEANRMLKLYIDIVPAQKPINRLLPVSVSGNKLNIGDLSDNCATFTQGGTLDAGAAERLKDTPAKYKGVDFICNLPQVTDNVIGTGSPEGINTVTLKGTKGDHKYFFLYTDRNVQPNYTILYNAVRSLSAK